MRDLDIVNDDFDSDVDVLDEDREELEEIKEKKPKPEVDTEAIRKQKTIKLTSTISKILAQGNNDKPILSLQKSIEKQIDEDTKAEKELKKKTIAKQQAREVGRVTPEFITDAEKVLKKVATKGVVQLFNAIKQAQKVANESTGIQKNIKELPAVTKKTFLKALKNESEKIESSQPEKPTVGFLKDDFALKESKHWDEEDE